MRLSILAAAFALSFAACSASSDDDVGATHDEAELRAGARVGRLADFLSGGDFACEGNGRASRWDAWRTVTVALRVSPAQRRWSEGWVSSASYDVPFVPGERASARFAPTNSHALEDAIVQAPFDSTAPDGALVRGNFWMRRGPSGIACRYERTSTVAGGEPRTATVEGTLRRVGSYFDDAFYSSTYPDVASAVSRGDYLGARHHYELHGKRAGLSPYCFDEVFYLQHNPDVAEAVRKGQVQSGRQHYDNYGGFEGRAGCGPRRPIIAAAGSGCDDELCIWITGSEWMNDSYVDVRRPFDSAILASYRGSDLVLNVGANPQSLSFRLDTEAERDLFTHGGLMVWVVNPSRGNWSEGLLVRR